MDLGIKLSQGQGALRVWGDMTRGQLVGATADTALIQVNTQLGHELAALELEQVQGRVSGRTLSGGFEFGTEGLQFQTRDGLRWPGGNVSVSYTQGEGRIPAQGDLRADRLDLQALSQIAHRLPVGPSIHAALLTYRPKGQVERIQAHWQGRLNAIEKYTARGRVTGLDIAARAATSGDASSSPGVRGLTADFDLTQAGGKARLSVQQGALDFPGVFDDPSVLLDQLSAEAQWSVEGENLSVQLSNVKFTAPDAQGELQAQWRTADPAKSSAHARLPGVLDLQGSMSRADGTRVYRYLPTVLPAATRDYVRHAVVAGKATGVKFRVKGDLADMPFANPRLGEFRISAQVQNATLAFVPRFLQGKDDLPWPVLNQLTGELVFDRASMQIKGANASVQQAPGLSVFKAEAQIPDLAHSVLTVGADLRGPVSDALRVVATSPLGAMIGHALDKATGTGSADYRLRLTLPLDTLEKTKVQGSVTLAGNDLHIAPNSPVLGRARGVIHFTEGGFSLVGAQARMLGGDARIEGGLRSGTGNSGNRDPVLQLRAQGTVTADGLRAARELGFLSRLAQNASGSTSYNASFGVRSGVPELSINSNMQGFSPGLPAPLTKSPESALPLRYETVLLRDGIPSQTERLRDRVLVEWGRLASLNYTRDVSGAEPRVLRGSIGIGLLPGESVPTPTDGVNANINLSNVDLDAWDALLARALRARATDLTAPSISAPRLGSDPDEGAQGYLPTSMAIRARELNYGPYRINNVVLGGSRDGLNWRANLQADELGGYLEYRQPNGSNPGRVYARLAQLRIAPSAVKQVENLLDEQPRAIPALDIVVDDLELRGKRMGRVEIEALNRGAFASPRDAGVREWRLNKFNIVNPEGSLTATGNWAALGNVSSPGSAPPERRRTVMNFKLDVIDAGGLLARLGMKDVVRRGHGKLEGQVSWLGSPLTLDYPSMAGQINVNVETGQFLQVEPGAAKLLGVLSLQSLPRRLILDFRDVFSAGFAFDFIRGDVQIENGIATTNNLQMKGVNAAVLMEGRADIIRETQNLKVVVIPEINAGTASLVAGIINPAIGLGSFLAQMFLRKPLMEAATQELHIDGTWTDYKVTKVEHKDRPANPTPEKP